MNNDQLREKISGYLLLLCGIVWMVVFVSTMAGWMK